MHVLPEKRVSADIAQHVVHPAHVPFEIKAQTADISGFGHHRPCGGFLCDHHAVRMAAEHHFIEQAQEINGFQIFTSAVHVGTPFSLPVVVEIQHGCDRVHAQAVHMELLNPEHCRGEQQIAHGNLAVIEYTRAPFPMFHLERVGVLVEI